VPPPINPNDWDRLFRSGAPRRGGPLRALANLLLICAAVGLVGGGAFFALRFGFTRAQQSAAQTAALISTSNAEVLAGRTATALAATAATPVPTAEATPTLAVAQPIGRSSVLNGGNLRSEPLLADTTVIGQICAGDQLDVLEQREVDGSLWYRIRVTEVGANCTAQRVTIGSLGWANSSLLAPLAP